LNQAVELHNAEMHRFLALEHGLFQLGLAHDEHLERYVHGLRSWIRGNIDWSVTTRRYQDNFSFQLPAPSTIALSPEAA
jgi:5-epi-alpha-selinene synthase